MVNSKERRRRVRQNGVINHISGLNGDSMAACGFLGIFTTRKVLDSLSEVSRDSTKPKKMIAEQENNF